jgi:hemoglobin
MLSKPRIPVSDRDICTVVAAFYARVRTDPVLAPIFAAHVGDWAMHERRITEFWRNAIFGTGGYDGNPMQVHKAAQNVQTEHFSHWLALFDAVLTDVLPPETAMAWSALAARIGRGLAFGLQASFQGAQAGVPRLLAV